VVGSRAGRAEAAEQKRERNEERKRAARLAAVETAITALEQRLGALARELEDAGTAGNVAQVRALGQAYNEVQAELTARLGEWEALAA
jgi:hypothetical protein